MSEEFKSILNDKVLVSNIYAGIYNLEIPIREDKEDVITIKLYEADKNGLVYRHIEEIGDQRYYKYYDINTGLEVELYKKNNYIPLNNIFNNLGKYISTNTMFELAEKYEKDHLGDTKLISSNYYVYKGQGQVETYNILDIERYYNAYGLNSENKVKKLNK